jgi:hypothetical protein
MANGLVRRGDGLAALGAAAIDDGAACGRGHTGAETVLFVGAAVVGLVTAFGHDELQDFYGRTLGPVKAEDFKARLWTGSSKKELLGHLIHSLKAARAD